MNKDYLILVSCPHLYQGFYIVIATSVDMELATLISAEISA